MNKNFQKTLGQQNFSKIIYSQREKTHKIFFIINEKCIYIPINDEKSEKAAIYIKNYVKKRPFTDFLQYSIEKRKKKTFTSREF